MHQMMLQTIGQGNPNYNLMPYSEPPPQNKALSHSLSPQRQRQPRSPQQQLQLHSPTSSSYRRDLESVLLSPPRTPPRVLQQQHVAMLEWYGPPLPMPGVGRNPGVDRNPGIGRPPGSSADGVNVPVSGSPFTGSPISVNSTPPPISVSGSSASGSPPIPPWPLPTLTAKGKGRGRGRSTINRNTGRTGETQPPPRGRPRGSTSGSAEWPIHGSFPRIPDTRTHTHHTYIHTHAGGKTRAHARTHANTHTHGRRCRSAVRCC